MTGYGQQIVIALLIFSTFAVCSIDLLNISLCSEATELYISQEFSVSSLKMFLGW